MAPLWYPLCYPMACLALHYQDIYFYQEWFGSESTLYEKDHDYVIDYATVKTKEDLLIWARRTEPSGSEEEAVMRDGRGRWA